MIVGLPKRTLLALPRVLGRKRTEPLANARRERRPNLFEAFAGMMERQAELILRGLGD